MTRRHTTLCCLFLGILVFAGTGHGAPAVSAEPTNFEEVFAKAKTGDVPAMLALARSYELRAPIRVPINFEESYRWYYKVALTGHPESQYRVGSSLVKKLFPSSEKNKKQASMDEGLGWLTKAAKQGYADAYEPLGDVHKEGKYVGRDLVAAYKWYHLSVLKTKYALGSERKRNELSKKLTAAQLIRAKIDADIHLNLMMK